jgi:hypothetical protein
MPSLVRNPLSLAGAWLATLGALAFLTYYAADELGLLTSPYAGLFGFFAAPAVFLLGLLLIPIGAWRERRRRAGGRAPWSWPVVHLGERRTRTVLGAVAVLTIVNLAIIAVAGLGATHYMETDEFCGQVCHTTMKPQYTAHFVAPHAEVGCVQCHVSPGAEGTIRAKLNGTRQLALMVTGGYERPIPSPAQPMPVAADTCWTCHTPGFPDRDMVIVKRDYASDEENTEYVTTLEMLTSRIHWHARPDVVVEYVAADPARDTIPWVRVTGPNGGETEYLAEGVTTRPEGEVRRMACMDCHSRPAHPFSASAEAAVDRALAAGTVSPDLPYVRREMVEVLTGEYASEEDALAAIARELPDFYQSRPDTSAAEVARAVAAAQQLYRLNVFPQMNVTWGTYSSQLGHAERAGCFRCHDDSHTASDGRAVRMDCELCHRIQG